MTKKLRVVNIVGKGHGWRKIFEDHKAGKLEGETWGCNDVFLSIPWCHKTFHMHDMEVFLAGEKTKYSTEQCIREAAERPNMPFYTLEHWDKIPSSVGYPLDDIVEAFGVCYFTSTIEYMLAMAIHEGFDVINFYGVNMTVKLEYIEQKPGVEFWLGLAMGRGIKCNLQREETSLLKSKDGLLYGYLINQWRVNNEN